MEGEGKIGIKVKSILIIAVLLFTCIYGVTHINRNSVLISEYAQDFGKETCNFEYIFCRFTYGTFSIQIPRSIDLLSDTVNLIDIQNKEYPRSVFNRMNSNYFGKAVAYLAENPGGNIFLSWTLQDPSILDKSTSGYNVPISIFGDIQGKNIDVIIFDYSLMKIYEEGSFVVRETKINIEFRKFSKILLFVVILAFLSTIMYVSKIFKKYKNQYKES